MKKWANYTLIISTVFLAACATKNTSNYKALEKIAPPPQDARGPVEYKPDAPARYIVKRGDTLWDISGRFLNVPARWREIWHKNPQIKNPHLIYPGDIISYITVNGQRKLQIAGSSNPIREKYIGRRTADGRPIYQVSRTVQAQDLDQPIPAIPKEAIYPFMRKNIIISPNKLNGYYPAILGQIAGDYVTLTSHKKIYAEGVINTSQKGQLYNVFRAMDAVIDPTKRKRLGIEATYVGQVKQLSQANPKGATTFIQTQKVRAFYPKDTLIPVEEKVIGGDLNFMPQLPRNITPVTIIKSIGSDGAYSIGQFSTILLNSGHAEGIVDGAVFKIVRAAGQAAVSRSGKVIRLPDYDLGIAIVYRTFDNTSYALVMNAYDVIKPGDSLVSP